MIKFELKGDEASEAKMVERILVVFGIGGAVPVFVQGKIVEIEVSEYRAEFKNQVDVDGLTREDPDRGVWVWEGIPVAVGQGEDFEYWDYSGGAWRKANRVELNALLDGESPWKEVRHQDPIDLVDQTKKKDNGPPDLEP